MVEVSKDGLMPVTEADRVAGHRLAVETARVPPVLYEGNFMNGEWDGWTGVQAFARHRIEATATLQAERDRYRELVNDAFEFLGGVDGATEIRGRLLTALSDTPTVQS